MIHVLTPIRKNEKVADDLSLQTVECKRFTHSCDIENRRDNEAYNRNVLKKHISDPYTLLMDADVVLTDEKTIEKMINFLDNYDFPAIAVDTKGLSSSALSRNCDVGHTVIACIMIRAEILKSIIFTHVDLIYPVDEELRKQIYIRGYPISNNCVCKEVNMQIRNFTGLPIPYLRNVKAKE